jgi:hypothetical protein
VISVSINRPVRKNELGFLGLQRVAELHVAGHLDHGIGIGLMEEDGAGPEDRAGSLGFAGPNCRCFLWRLVWQAALPVLYNSDKRNRPLHVHAGGLAGRVRKSQKSPDFVAFSRLTDRYDES